MLALCPQHRQEQGLAWAGVTVASVAAEREPPRRVKAGGGGQGRGTLGCVWAARPCGWPGQLELQC